MKLPRHQFLIWPQALALCRPCRVSQWRKPIAGVYLRKLIDAQFQFMPYRGGALPMQDLLVGQFDLFITNASIALPQVRPASAGLCG